MVKTVFLPNISAVPKRGETVPVLSIIYTNDITSEVDVSSNINLFADETKKISQSNTTLQNSLNKTYNCLKQRKLNLNPSKFQVLSIPKKNTTISTFDL